MPDANKKQPLTTSEMIRRAVRNTRLMTPEQRWALIDASRLEAERIHASFYGSKPGCVDSPPAPTTEPAP